MNSFFARAVAIGERSTRLVSLCVPFGDFGVLEDVLFEFESDIEFPRGDICRLRTDDDAFDTFAGMNGAFAFTDTPDCAGGEEGGVS